MTIYEHSHKILDLQGSQRHGTEAIETNSKDFLLVWETATSQADDWRDQFQIETSHVDSGYTG